MKIKTVLKTLFCSLIFILFIPIASYTAVTVNSRLPKTAVDFSVSKSDLRFVEDQNQSQLFVRPGIEISLSAKIKKTTPEAEGGGTVVFLLNGKELDRVPFFIKQKQDYIMIYEGCQIPLDVFADLASGERTASVFRAEVIGDALVRDPNPVNNSAQIPVQIQGVKRPVNKTASDASIVSIKTVGEFGNNLAESGGPLSLLVTLKGSGKPSIVDFIINGSLLEEKTVILPEDGSLKILSQSYHVPYGSSGIIDYRVTLDNGAAAFLQIPVVPFEYEVIPGSITWKSRGANRNFIPGESLFIQAKVLRMSRYPFIDKYGALRVHFLIDGKLSPALQINAPSGSEPYIGNVSYSYKVPEKQTAPLDVEVVVDAGGLFTESREDNNSASVMISGAIGGKRVSDVSIDNRSIRFAPSYAVPGEKIELIATVRNNASVLPEKEVRLLYKINGQAIDFPDAGINRTYLLPGQTYTVHKMWIVPENASSDLKYTVEIDPEGLLRGDNPADNSASITIPLAMLDPASVHNLSIIPAPVFTDSGGSSSDEYIARQNAYLSQLSESDQDETTLINGTVNALDEIGKAVAAAEDPQEAVRTFQLLLETLKPLPGLLAQVRNPDQMIDRVSNLTDSARYLVLRIQDQGKLSELTARYLESLNGVLEQSDENNIPGINLKNQAHGLSVEAVRKVGTLVTPSDSVTIVNGVGNTQFDSQTILQHIDTASNNYRLISTALSTLLGKDNPRKLPMTITLQTERPARVTQLEANIEKTLLESIYSKGINQLTLGLGTASVTFQSDMLKPGQNRLKTSAAYYPAPDERVRFLPWKTRSPSGNAVVSMELIADQGNSGTFGTPVLLAVNLSDMELSTLTETERRSLGLYVWDESRKNWLPAGGNYDPISKVIRVNRLHLSKYTVLVSDRSFSDVKNSWARDDINELLGKGVIQDASIFSPQKDMTREEFGRWIAKVYGLVGEPESLPFKDIPSSHPSYKELAGAYAQGLITGKTGTAFEPKGKVTRQEMARLIAGALVKYSDATLESALNEKLTRYKDSESIGSDFRESVALISELGIMLGDEYGFRPTDPITREEGAAVLKRIYN